MEIIIHIKSAITLTKLGEVVKNIREIEKEHNCNCTLLDIEVFDQRLMRVDKNLLKSGA